MTLKERNVDERITLQRIKEQYGVNIQTALK